MYVHQACCIDKGQKNPSNFPLGSWSMVIVLHRKPSGYRIARNFQGRKLSLIGEKHDFRGENFPTFTVPKDTTLPNFAEKKIATKLQIVKVLSHGSPDHFSLKEGGVWRWGEWRWVGCVEVGVWRREVVIVSCPPRARLRQEWSGERN